MPSSKNGTSTWNMELSEGGFERGKLEDLFERLLCVEECETKGIIHFSLGYLLRNHPGILFCTKVQLQPCLVFVQVSSERWGRVRRPHQEFPRDAYPPQVSSTFWLHLQVLQRPSGSVHEIHPIPSKDIGRVVGSRRSVTRLQRVVSPELRMMRTRAKFGIVQRSFSFSQFIMYAEHFSIENYFIWDSQ
jgi:hypothetical protein